MARLNPSTGSSSKTRNGGPARFEDPPATPQKVITSPSKGAGLMDTARRLIFGSRATNNEHLHPKTEQQEDDEDEERNDLKDSDLVADEDAQAVQDNVDDTHISMEQMIPSSSFEIQIPASSKGKRKQLAMDPESELDVYDVQDEEPPAKRLRSRAKVVAKKPIASGRHLRGQPSIAQSEETIQNVEAHPTVIKKAKGTKTQPKSTGTTAIIAPKKRGRPKKPSKENEIQSEASGSSSAAPAQTLPSPEAHDGDTGLYMSQSPVKNPPLPPKGRLVHPNPKNRPSGGAMEQRNESTFAEVSDDEDPDVVVDGQTSKPTAEEPGEEAGEKDGDDITGAATELDSSQLIKIGYLEDMLTLANRAGCSLTKGEERDMLQEADRMFKTNEGKNVQKTLDKLSDAIEKLPQGNDPDDADKGMSAQSLIDECTMSLKEKIQTILDTRFKKPASTDKTNYDSTAHTKKVLRDVYFFIIPHFLEVMVMIAKSDPLQKSMETSRLERFLELVNILCTLIHRACDLPTSHQPEVTDLEGKYGTKTFSIRQPARHLRPQIRHVRKLLRLELKEREIAGESARDEEQRLAEEQKQLERDRKAAIERRRKIQEDRNRTKEVFQKHPIFSDPLWAPIVKRDLQEDEAKRRISSQAHHSQRQSAGTSRRKQDDCYDPKQGQDDLDLDFDKDPGDIFDNEERVRGVFPSNNRHDGNRPWAETEKATFIDIMREDAGEDRYARVAEVLQRSLDEVFAWAKEVQDAFDDAHEKGMLNDEGDLWTFDVWAKPGSPRQS